MYTLSPRYLFLFMLIIFLQESSACDFKCPPHSYPYPNPHFQKSANGCGTSEINFNPEYLPHPYLEDCCNQHDYCYETCGVSKEYCDISFRKCMFDVCGSGLCALKCNLKAKIFYGIAKNLGCDSYLKSQEKACLCY